LKLPGPPGGFLFGNFPQLAARKDDYIVLVQEFLQTYGPIWRLLGFKHSVFLAGADAVRDVMKKDTPKGFTYNFLHPWLGIGLLTSNGDVWRRKRRLLTPAFHFKILRGYLKVFTSETEILIEKWKKYAESGESFDIFPEITCLTLDIIGRCAFGYHINAQNKPLSDYVVSTKRASQTIFDRTFHPFYWFEFIYRFTGHSRQFRRDIKTIHDLPNTVIKNRREEYARLNIQEEHQLNRDVDFLDMLMCVQDEPLKDEEIRDEVDTFMFEGHDTTASGLTWCLYLLAAHPDVQAKVHDEIDQVLGDRLAPDYEDLDKFPYTTMVIKEALRLYPPVPFLARITEEPLEILGYEIPTNTEIFLSPYLIHRNPKDWPNVKDLNAFDPENFSPEKMKNRDPFAFIPFSAGNRNCIGQNFAMNEEKCVIVMLMKQFRLRLEPGQKIEPEPNLVLRPKYGIRISLSLR